METGESLIQASLPPLIGLLKKALGNRLHILDVKLLQSKQVSVKTGDTGVIDTGQFTISHLGKCEDLWGPFHKYKT